jgi:hypothetical protein
MDGCERAVARGWTGARGQLLGDLEVASHNLTPLWSVVRTEHQELGAAYSTDPRT